MNKLLILTIIGLFLSYSSISQHLFEGQILDESTGEPIKDAHIIILGTTKGTNSNSDGTFELETDNRRETVVVSHMSYIKNQTKISSRDDFFTIKLKKNIYQLNSVNVGLGEYDGPSEFKEFDSTEYNASLESGFNNREKGEFALVEESFNFFGGLNNLKAYFAVNFRYPEKVLKEDLSGTVYALFTITEEGEANDIEFVKPDGQINEAIQMELVRVINSMPKWFPAFQRGKPVPVRVVIPFSYAANGYAVKK